jgi:hypothetical protein
MKVISVTVIQGVTPATMTTAMVVAWASDAVQQGDNELGEFP